MWNTTVTIRRNTTTDPREMPTNGTTAASYTGVRAQLIESERLTQTASSTTQRTIRKATLRVLGDTDVQVNDRIEDEVTGKTYVVDEVTSPSVHLPLNLGKRAILRRTN